MQRHNLQPSLFQQLLVLRIRPFGTIQKGSRAHSHGIRRLHETRLGRKGNALRMRLGEVLITPHGGGRTDDLVDEQFRPTSRFRPSGGTRSHRFCRRAEQSEGLRVAVVAGYAAHEEDDVVVFVFCCLAGAGAARTGWWWSLGLKVIVRGKGRAGRARVGGEEDDAQFGELGREGGARPLDDGAQVLEVPADVGVQAQDVEADVARVAAQIDDRGVAEGGPGVVV